MFDLFGNIEETQKKIAAKLDKTPITTEAGDGLIKVQATASRKLLNIQVDASLLNPAEKEELEDLLVVAINRALEKAEVKASAEMRKMAGDLLPGGLGGISNLFS